MATYQLLWKHWGRGDISNSPVVVAGAILGKASSSMLFLKDGEGLARKREGSVLQEEEHPVPKQSHGHE